MNRAQRAAKKEKEQKELAAITSNIKQLQESYNNELDSNPVYSLEIDPTGKYNFTDEQINFIRQYVNTKNLAMASTLANINNETAATYFANPAIQSEIRRINLAMYQRQFQSRLFTIDEIGGYLSSLLVDNNVPLSDQLSTTSKLHVAQMIIDLNKFKAQAVQNPDIINAKDFEVQVKDLSVETIKQLIETNNSIKDKQHLISENFSDLSPEELVYLTSLSTNELLKLIDENNKGGKHD